jgi:hypothetical protein
MHFRSSIFCAIARSVTRLQRRAILSTGTTITSGHFRELSTVLCCGQMKKARSGRLADLNGLPSASDPETGADRTPRESLLACMTANREPSNQSFEIDREATVCTASRRFLPLCGRENNATHGTTSLVHSKGTSRTRRVECRREDRSALICADDGRCGRCNTAEKNSAEPLVPRP